MNTFKLADWDKHEAISDQTCKLLLQGSIKKKKAKKSVTTKVKNNFKEKLNLKNKLVNKKKDFIKNNIKSKKEPNKKIDSESFPINNNNSHSSRQLQRKKKLKNKTEILPEKVDKSKIRNKTKKKQERNYLNPVSISNNKKRQLSLRERMMERLKAARFRYINEQIYTSTSKDAQTIFTNDPEAFKAYHEGYRQQVDRWPINPVDLIIKNVKRMPKSHVIVDFGCGDAILSKSVVQTVHSFDLVAVNESVTPCDMKNVPLDDSTVDVAVFCLSLMGTNLQDYILEANRVLKVGGLLKIAEVESRFDDVDVFIEGVKRFGFKILRKDDSHKLFNLMDFKKEINVINRKKLPTLSLHPCLYKKR